MPSLFDSPEASEHYLALLNLVDDFRNELYILQDSGEPVEDLIEKIFELEEDVLKCSEGS